MPGSPAAADGGRVGAETLTCVLGDLQIGGVPRLYIDILTRLQQAGVATRIVAPDGTLRPLAQERGIAWEPIDWTESRLATYERVRSLLAPGGRALVTADPAIVHVMPALAAAGPAAAVFHGTAPRLPDWFGEARLARLVRLVSELERAGRLRVLTIGSTYVEEYARLFELPVERIALLAPGVDSAAIEFRPVAGPVRSVLSLCRLSPEKAPHVLAAVELVAEGLAQGRACHLDVVGDGPWRAEAEAVCERRLPPGSWTFHGATTAPLDAMRRADAVLATGLTALEAASAGVRVVIVRTTPDDAGPLGPVMTRARYQALARDSFGARSQPPAAPRDVWADLDAVGIEELAAVRAAVDANNSLAVTAETLVEAFASLGRPPLEPAAGGVGAAAAALEDELSRVQRLADEIWAARVRFEAERDQLLAERDARSTARSDQPGRGPST